MPIHSWAVSSLDYWPQVITKEAELSETLEEERELLLLAFTLFRDALAAGHAELQAAAAAAAAAAVATDPAAEAASLAAAVDGGAASEPADGAAAGAAAADGAGGAAAAAAEVEAERRAWFTFTVASLRGFARRYGAAAAPLAARLQAEVFAEGAALAEVRAAVLEGLGY